MLPRVLVVDDNEINRQLIEWALEGRAETASLAGGRECCSTIAAWRPAVVFLDLMMPDYSGFDVLSEMQAQMPAELGKVVIVTAADEAGARTRTKDFAIGGWCDKPLSIDQITRCFDRICAA